MWRNESGCDCVGVIARVIRRVCGKGSFDCGRSVCVCVCVCDYMGKEDSQTSQPGRISEYTDYHVKIRSFSSCHVSRSSSCMELQRLKI